MKAITKTLGEALVLLVAALAVAYAANAKRESGTIKWTKNYFDTGERLVSATAPAGDSGTEPVAQRPANGRTAGPSGTDDGPEAADNPAERDRSAAAAERKSPQATTVKHLEHPYQEVSFEEVVEVVNDPNTAVGLNVLIDARNDANYESGHIPGAIQCDPYNVEPYIDNVLAYAMGAEKVIVYCGGGQCEDSIFMCRELIGAGVPYEAVYLYPGGWREWAANDMPVETGR